MGHFSEEIEAFTTKLWEHEGRKGELRIPTLQELAAHVLRNRSSITEMTGRIDALALAACPGVQLDSLFVPSSFISMGTIDAKATLAAIYALWAEKALCGDEEDLSGGVAYLYMAACGYDVGAYAGADEGTVERGVVATHAVWETYGKKVELKHPIAPLVSNWLDTPPVVEPDTRRTGIFPKGIDPHSRAYTLPHMPTAPAPLDAALGEITDTAYLPGLAPLDSPVEAAMPLALYDMSGSASVQSGRTAPMALRLFVEALMLLKQEDRGGRRRVRRTLRDLRDWLYPIRPERYKLSRILPLVRRALYHVDALRVRAVLPGEKAATLWRPVSVTGYPVDSLDSPVIFDIELPPGSSSGALVDREALRLAGVQSALRFRALLTLYVEWDRYGTHVRRLPGNERKQVTRRVYATRPRVLRDGKGGLVDVRGNQITDKHGRQRSDWSKGVPIDENGQPTVWAGAAREPNPARDRYPVYIDNDLLRLCYAADVLTKKNRRERLRNARRTLLELEREGFLTIEQGAKSTEGTVGWRVMPPDGFAPMP